MLYFGTSLLVCVTSSCCLVAVGSCIVIFLGPFAAGSGVPEVKCTLNGVHVSEWLSAKTLICKVLSLFSFASES